MTMINAGYEIIKSEAYSCDWEIVLGVKDNKYLDSDKEYVVWDHEINTPNYIWGHYFGDKKDALIDFHKTLIERYEV